LPFDKVVLRLAAALLFGVVGCGAGMRSAGSDAPNDGGSDSLAQRYAGYFPIGAAVGNWQLDNVKGIVDKDFAHLTCENAMKQADIHPAEATFNWADADRIADYARARGIKLTGHTLLWHRQVPDWMFAGVTAGDATSLELLKSRLKAHIEAVVGRYADVVDNWDVVNEAISDAPNKTYRDGSEMSKWFELFGSEEYIAWAYRYARDALEAKSAGSSRGKLYYNEYTVTIKVDKILTMFDWLKQKGIVVDGVGFQSHENMRWPSTTDLQTAFDRFRAAGYKVKISELDVTVYDDYATGTLVPSPQTAFTPDIEATQAARYQSLFELYRKNRELITSVTFWGVSDDRSWLNDWPVPGRTDYPLLYDAAHKAKRARGAIMDFR
jgi:endo-1,4-beta-xylanase